MSEEAPAEFINVFKIEFGLVEDESDFLELVHQIPALKDSDDDHWNNRKSWQDAYRLIAAADTVGERGWRASVSPIFERTARGQLDGLMQSVRHGPEQAFQGDLNAFADVLEPLVDHERAGTRQWTIRELGILRLERSRIHLVRALSDSDATVADEAVSSLAMLPDST